MIRVLYDLIVLLVDKMIWIPAFFSKKLKLGIDGRKQTFDKLSAEISSSDKVIWMHVASLGEFEQGRPVLERLKEAYPEKKILLSFFSPSGYEPRKNYEYADVICYLPLDTRVNAKRFLKLAHPELIVFVKYELWPNFLHAIGEAESKAILISTLVGSDNGLLKIAPRWFGKIMGAFDYIFTQDIPTAEFLRSLKLSTEIIASGDTRVDRTLSIAKAAEDLPKIADFCKDAKVLIAGSTWAADEAFLQSLFESDYFDSWKIIIAPHDISEPRIQQVISRFKGALRYSDVSSTYDDYRVLVIDNIGMLNRLYRYGHIAYIGGGFGSGIHNTLEPAAFNLPIFFGPKYQKFIEAKALVISGGAFTFSNTETLLDTFGKLNAEDAYNAASESVRQFMKANKGATDEVVEMIDQLLDKDS